MSAKTEFFAPDYLPRFRCKMGACRSACCVGWPVSVSMKNYFTLLGLPCRKELRDRLDVALRLADHPTEEEYARFTPNWLGDCPMRMEDGRCSIQAELGEDALSDVCRLYPRGVRIWEGRLECSASNSCERTLELLWDEKEPMRFGTCDLSVVPPPSPGSPRSLEGMTPDEEFRFSLIRLMQDRSRRVEERILSLRAPLGLPGEPREEPASAVGMLRYYADRSDSIREKGTAIAARYGEESGKWEEDAADFDRRIPAWERFAEQVLVNHMFFTQFPYLGVTRRETWASLAAAYALTRIYAVGGFALMRRDGGDPGQGELVDLTAEVFRLIGHTPFEKSVSASLGGRYGILPLTL